MRTRKSTATFQKPFVLNRSVGELPAGRYDIDIDEQEIDTMELASYRRTAIYLYVREGTSTRTVAATPSELDKALALDSDPSSTSGL